MRAQRFRQFALTLALAWLVVLPAAPLGAAPLDPANDPGSNGRYARLAVADRLFHLVFIAGEAGTPGNLIDTTAPVHTRIGEFTGPGGILLYLQVLRATYPDATFERTAVSDDGNLVSVDWTGASATGPLWGKMLAAVEASKVVKLVFIDSRP